MLESPLVSVIIPTYNREDLILRAINSVLEQSYKNLEIIVVDDYSQDNTAEVIKGIDDRRLRYYCHSTNRGGSAARNTGIEAAQGKYIAFLDSDDVWLPEKLTLQLQAIAQQANNADRVVCYSQFQKSYRVFYQPSILPRRGKKAREAIADYFWLGGGEILTSTILVSRTLANAHPFQLGLPKHQDLDFILNLDFQDTEFIFIPQILTIWHNEPRSDRISRRNNYQLSIDWIESYRERISSRAYQGFMLKEIAPKMLSYPDSKPIAMKLLVAGLKSRIIPWYYFLFLTIKQAISTESKQFLKFLLQRMKLLKKT